jgi:signal peptidase II
MNKNKKKLIIEYAVYAAVIALGIIIDQITKLVAVKELTDSGSVTFIKGLIDFTYVENRGMAWGMFADHRWVFMVFSTVAIVVLTGFLVSGKSPSKLYSTAIALVISGGVGNMIDRVALGYVVDFIEFTFFDFPVFNVADSLVTVGAFGLIILLTVDIVRESINESRKKKGKKDADDA